VSLLLRIVDLEDLGGGRRHPAAGTAREVGRVVVVAYHARPVLRLLLLLLEGVVSLVIVIRLLSVGPRPMIRAIFHYTQMEGAGA
jgi:hypothetical protein